MVTESPHMSYVGKNFGQSKLQHSHNLMKHYVGVYDQKTGKMKVYDTEMFNMLPYIPGNEKDEPDAPAPEKTFKERTDMLTSAFGSSKKRKVLDTKTRHAVDETTLESAMKSTVDQGVKEGKTFKIRADETIDNPENSTIPPYDKEAKTAEDVYKLSDILSENDLNQLHNSAKVFYDSSIKQIVEWTKEEKYPSHVLTKLQTMPIEEEERWLRSKCLLYMTFLINFLRLSHKQLHRLDALPESCPVSIKRKLQDNFTILVQDGGRSKRVRPDRLKDRLISYILVLALIIDEFSLVPLDLQKDLRLGKSKMGHYLRALGCKLKKSRDPESFNYEAILRVPLTFPKVKVKRS